MVELTALILLNRLTSWGRAPVIATRVIPADASTLHAFVSDPASQWRVVDGVHRLLRAHAQVGPRTTKRLVPVRVQLGGRDVLWLTWILGPSRGTTEVDLAVQVETRGVLARLLLLGGRGWLRHRLEDTLDDLAMLAHRAAEDLDDIEREAEIPLAPDALESIETYPNDPRTVGGMTAGAEQ
jgi:hypothetical protein